MGNGGGGFSGGSANAVNGPAAQGYAAGATDTGHEGGSGSFALGADGKLNWQLIRDNGHVGIHEMTVTGKALTQALYGMAPRFSYFNGCSTGGRQGLMEVQRYPQDYNGVMSGAPAINWNRLHVQQMWGAVVMNIENNPVPACKQTAATNAAIASCDALDGVTDGVIEDPNRCKFDPKALVGTSAGGECGTFTEADANVIRKLWEGPRRKDGSFLWYGLPKGRSPEFDFAGWRQSAATAGLRHFAGMVPVLPDAERAVRLDHDHLRRLRAFLRSVGRAIRRRDRNRQSGSDGVQEIAAARRSSGTAGPIR